MKTPRGGRPTLGSPLKVLDMDQSEDCLFLDVYVPSSIFSNDTGLLPLVVLDLRWRIR